MIDAQDFVVAARFLTLLDEEAAQFTFQTFDDNKARKAARKVTGEKDPLVHILTGSFDAYRECLRQLNNQGAGVFVTVNETDGTGRTKENITRVRAIWQEQDRPECPELPTKPHIVVESSPGNFHRYVLVDGCTLCGFRGLQDRMVESYGSDPGAADIARVLRLPGFFHMKYDDSCHMVSLVENSGEMPLSYEEAKRIFPPVVRQPRATPTPSAGKLDADRVAEITSAVNALGPDLPYFDWLNVGVALHDEFSGHGDGLSIWDAWSSRGECYRSGECAYKWGTFQTGKGVTINTVFKMAAATGWRWKETTLPHTAAAPVEDQDNGEAMEIDTQDWPILSEAALHGLAGDFVRLACRSSEADPAAVLITFMVRFGVECGRAPTLYVGDAKHHARLAAVIVGASSKARKGTSAKPVERLFKDMEWLATASPGPFSSGEGIIYAVRDPLEKFDEKAGQMVTVDPGVPDKRLFVLDEEFAGALASTKREGNTLSMVIRCAWDGGTFDPLTKTNKIKATKAHIGWVSHITLDELRRKLGDSEAFNGFANRILWTCATRSKEIAFPFPMPDDELNDIRARVSTVLVFRLSWKWTFKLFALRG